MRPFLIAATLAASFSASADMVIHKGDDWVRLQQKPCDPSVLRHIQEGQRGYFRQAWVTFEGKQYRACWAVRQDGMVLLVYPDGDGGLIPAALFREEPDA